VAAAIDLFWDLNDGSSGIIEQAQDALAQAYHLPVEKLGKFTVSSAAYDSIRHQHAAAEVVKQVRSKTRRGALGLGVVEVDLYAPGLNFVFGQADRLEQAAVVSVHRLRGEKALPRIRTEVVHEVGHLLGLGHCHRSDCVMFFSNTVYDTDRKGEKLCADCQGRLNGGL
jgi:archaemetzincin